MKHSQSNIRGLRGELRFVRPTILISLFLFLFFFYSLPVSGSAPDLQLPPVLDHAPGPGLRVRQYHPQYCQTGLYHLLYLPTDWKPWKRYPVIVEYAGNQYQTSPGTVEGSHLGFGLTGGSGAIWLCMPYVNTTEKRNQLTWWGDPEATVTYCLQTVERICSNYGGDPKNLILAGFSRGSIACNYIGLRNDQIAALWKGFFCHSHYDGANENWPYPDADRQSAIQRLKRLGNRPQLISDPTPSTRPYLQQVYPMGNFTWLEGDFGGHNDTWILHDNPQRTLARNWFHSLLQTSLK